MTSEPTDVLTVDYSAAIAASILWLALVIFQVSDFGLAVLDERNVARSGDTPRVFVQRFAPYFWALPLFALVGLSAVLGVAYAARLILSGGNVPRGIAIFLALTALVFLIGAGVLVVATRREWVTYASLRAHLQSVSLAKLPKQEVDLIRQQLAAIDDRERDLRIGRRNTSNYRQLKSELDALVRRFTKQPPHGLEVFDAVRWGTATRFVWTSSAWRLVPVLVAVAPLVSIFVVGGSAATVAGIPLWVLLLGPAPLSYLAAVGSARASLAAKVSRRAAGERVRADIEKSLAGLDRGSRKGVAGLGERVTRALQILREQQR